MEFKLDPKMAKNADDVIIPIPKTGLYKGRITQAKEVMASSGTRGIKFTFECPQGTAEMPVWTIDSNGNQVFGLNLVYALMTCLKVKAIKSVPKEVDEYDFDLRQVVKKTAEVFPDLCGNVAVIIQKEEFINRNGEIRERFNIRHFLNYETLQTASEILEEREASRYKDLVDKYKDKKLDSAPPQTSFQAAQQTYSAPKIPEPIVEVDEDEIPF
jgi:hypothetical protein